VSRSLAETLFVDSTERNVGGANGVKVSGVVVVEYEVSVFDDFENTGSVV